MNNKEIARELNKWGFIDDKGLFVSQRMKFLEKVSNNFFILKSNVNGVEMGELFKFLKRNSSTLFVPRYGMASRIYEFRTKFLLDKYWVLKHEYGPNTELAVIE